MILTKEMLEEEHSAAKYLPWVKSLIAAVKKADDGIEAVRLGIGLSKVLIEEALPIGTFASHHYCSSNDVFVSLKIGSQHFDATVRDKRVKKSPIKYLEVTSTMAMGASDGYDDYLLKHHLHHHGLSGTGTISHRGTKKSGIITNVDRGVICQEDVLKHERTTVQEAIDRKSKIPYPPNTALIIAFDDVFAFDRKDNIGNLESVLELNADRLSNFSWISIVGTQQGLFMEREIRSVAT